MYQAKYETIKKIWLFPKFNSFNTENLCGADLMFGDPTISIVVSWDRCCWQSILGFFIKVLGETFKNALKRVNLVFLQRGGCRSKTLANGASSWMQSLSCAVVYIGAHQTW